MANLIKSFIETNYNVADLQAGNPLCILPTVTNKSSFGVWVKPENSMEPELVEAYSQYFDGIDGITHPTKKGQVYKIRAGLDCLFGVIVYDGGLYLNQMLSPISDDINLLIGGGWLDKEPDPSWNLIFEKARK